MPDINLDDVRMQGVLSDAAFPGSSWQLIAHAEHRGADWKSLAELRALPPGDYRHANAVLTALRRIRKATAARNARAANRALAATQQSTKRRGKSASASLDLLTGT